jgi:hypothetical protein
MTPEPTPTPLTTVTQTTDLGTVSLDIPAPFIPVGTEIAIEAHPIEDEPREVRDAGARQAFHVIEPQALTFAEPVALSLTLPRSLFTRDDGTIAVAYPAMRSPDGHWDWLADARMAIAADSVTLTGTTTHLGALFAWGDLTNLEAIASTIGPLAVGQGVRPLLALHDAAGRADPTQVVGTPELLVDNPTVLSIGPASPPSLSRDITCLAPGPFVVTFVGELANFGADTTFLTDTLHLTQTTGELSYVMTGLCALAAPSTAPPTPPNSSPSSSP